MKPEQFIRELGEKKVRKVVEGAPEGADHIADFAFSGEYTYLKNIKGNEYDEFGSGGWVHVNHLTFSSELSLGLVCIDLSDLKRLVESLDLIKSYGGIEQCRKEIEWVESSKLPETDLVKELKQAIRDHESIYGGGDES